MSADGRDSQDGLMSLFAGIGVGVIVGAAVALLLAPQAGVQTRAQLKESADDALGRLRDSMDDLRHRVEELSGRRGGPGYPQQTALQGEAAGATDDTDQTLPPAG